MKKPHQNKGNARRHNKVPGLCAILKLSLGLRVLS